MDDLDLGAFGDIDFDSIEKKVEADQVAHDDAANKEMIELRKGADSCEGGACKL